MANPILIPGAAADTAPPLCPWRTPEHAQLYAPVDHTQDAFDSFCSIASSADWTAASVVVLISGPEGCGKTALLHRCAGWLDGFLGVHGRSPTMIPLESERIAGAASADQAHHLASRLIDHLELEAVFAPSDQQRLSERRDVPGTALPYLSALLMRATKTAVLLFPPIETPEELNRCIDFARPSMFLFCESSFDEVAQHADKLRRTRADKQIVQLTVHALDIDDGWRFIDARLASDSLNGRPSQPVLTEATVRQFMDMRIQGRGRTSIRELYLTCVGVYERAIALGLTEITYQDFLEYYARKAVIQ